MKSRPKQFTTERAISGTPTNMHRNNQKLIQSQQQFQQARATSPLSHQANNPHQHTSQKQHRLKAIDCSPSFDFDNLSPLSNTNNNNNNKSCNLNKFTDRQMPLQPLSKQSNRSQQFQQQPSQQTRQPPSSSFTSIRQPNRRDEKENIPTASTIIGESSAITTTSQEIPSTTLANIMKSMPTNAQKILATILKSIDTQPQQFQEQSQCTSSLVLESQPQSHSFIVQPASSKSMISKQQQYSSSQHNNNTLAPSQSQYLKILQSNSNPNYSNKLHDRSATPPSISRNNNNLPKRQPPSTPLSQLKRSLSPHDRSQFRQQQSISPAQATTMKMKTETNDFSFDLQRSTNNTPGYIVPTSTKAHPRNNPSKESLTTKSSANLKPTSNHSRQQQSQQQQQQQQPNQMKAKRQLTLEDPNTEHFTLLTDTSKPYPQYLLPTSCSQAQAKLSNHSFIAQNKTSTLKSTAHHHIKNNSNTFTYPNNNNNNNKPDLINEQQQQQQSSCALSNSSSSRTISSGSSINSNINSNRSTANLSTKNIHQSRTHNFITQIYDSQSQRSTKNVTQSIQNFASVTCPSEQNEMANQQSNASEYSAQQHSQLMNQSKKLSEQIQDRLRKMQENAIQEQHNQCNSKNSNNLNSEREVYEDDEEQDDEVDMSLSENIMNNMNFVDSQQSHSTSISSCNNYSMQRIEAPTSVDPKTISEVMKGLPACSQMLLQKLISSSSQNTTNTLTTSQLNSQQIPLKQFSQKSNNISQSASQPITSQSSGNTKSMKNLISSIPINKMPIEQIENIKYQQQQQQQSPEMPKQINTNTHSTSQDPDDVFEIILPNTQKQKESMATRVRTHSTFSNDQHQQHLQQYHESNQPFASKEQPPIANLTNSAASFTSALNQNQPVMLSINALLNKSSGNKITSPTVKLSQNIPEKASNRQLELVEDEDEFSLNCSKAHTDDHYTSTCSRSSKTNSENYNHNSSRINFNSQSSKINFAPTLTTHTTNTTTSNTNTSSNTARSSSRLLPINQLNSQVTQQPQEHQKFDSEISKNESKQSDRIEIQNLHLTVSEKDAEIMQLKLKLQDLQKIIGLQQHENHLTVQNQQHQQQQNQSVLQQAQHIPRIDPIVATTIVQSKFTHQESLENDVIPPDLQLSSSSQSATSVPIPRQLGRLEELDRQIIATRISHYNSTHQINAKTTHQKYNSVDERDHNSKNSSQMNQQIQPSNQQSQTGSIQHSKNSSLFSESSSDLFEQKFNEPSDQNLRITNFNQFGAGIQSTHSSTNNSKDGHLKIQTDSKEQEEKHPRSQSQPKQQSQSRTSYTSSLSSLHQADDYSAEIDISSQIRSLRINNQ